MTSKYHKPVKGTTIDVYDVLVAFNVTCPARQHAIKKLLMAGQRGAKDTLQDLKEVQQAVTRAIELAQPEPGPAGGMVGDAYAARQLRDSAPSGEARALLGEGYSDRRLK